MTGIDGSGAGCLSILVGEGYKGLAAMYGEQLAEWRQGIEPSLAAFLRNTPQARGQPQQPAATPVASAAFHGQRSQLLLDGVVDFGLLAAFNRHFEAAKGSLEKVAQSGDILSLDRDALLQFMPYMDAALMANPYNNDVAEFGSFCTGMAAAHFFPSLQNPIRELFSRLKVKNVAFVNDLSKLEWDDESQERTLPIPYDTGRPVVNSVVFGLRIIYHICMMEPGMQGSGVQGFDTAQVENGLQLAWARLGRAPDKLKAELDAHSEAAFGAVSQVRPHFGVEEILKKTPRLQEADRKGYLLAAAFDTLTSAYEAAERSLHAARAEGHPEAGKERMYVYGIGLTGLLRSGACILL